MLRATRITVAALVVVLLGAAKPTTRPAPPVGNVESPRHITITSADIGPDIDPAKLAAQPFNSLPLFGNFSVFMSGSFAVAQVWVYADNDEQALHDTRLSYTFPEFYKPTWGEVFDHVGRQMRCRWEWNPKNRQFKFYRSDAEPFFGVKLAEGWRREDRGMYVWHAPKDMQFGMDIYYFGHYTAAADKPNLMQKVREHVAMMAAKPLPNAPGLDAMKLTKVGDADALYLEHAPRPDALWRQWSVVVDGHAFLIVSAMPKERAADIRPPVDEMVKTFKLETAGEKGKAQ